VDSGGRIPGGDVTTIRDLIYYAKIPTPTALHAPDGTATKADYCGFINQTFHELQHRLFTKG
jgi:hypothetical protein